MLAVVCPIEGAVPERYGQLIDTVLQNAKKYPVIKRIRKQQLFCVMRKTFYTGAKCKKNWAAVLCLRCILTVRGLICGFMPF